MIFSIVFEHLDWSRHRNRSNRRRKIISAQRSKINGASAENCSGPENKNASISLCKPLETRMIFSIVFERLDWSRHRNRSSRRRKIVFARRSKINGASAEIVRAPKIKCVDFLMQTFRNAYDFFDRFRAPRLIGASKSIESTSKNHFRAKKQNQRRVGGKLFGPRK